MSPDLRPTQRSHNNYVSKDYQPPYASSIRAKREEPVSKDHVVYHVGMMAMHVILTACTDTTVIMHACSINSVHPRERGKFDQNRGAVRVQIIFTREDEI